MAAPRTPRRRSDDDAGPDWSKARVGDPAPCVDCGRPALMRDPISHKPRHKVCGDRPQAQQAADAA